MELLWPPATSPLELAPDDVHVWAVPLDRSISVRESSIVLSPDERRRAEQFSFDEPRVRFTVGRIALRNLLGQYLAIPAPEVMLACDSNGKPRLGMANDSAALRFNLAHSAELIVLAVARGCEVGIDVERFRAGNHWDQIARRYFHDSELREILAADAAERSAAFFRCWTSKEAIVKAVGAGLSRSLSSFRVSVDDHDGMWVDTPDQTSRRRTCCWLQQFAPCVGYIAAVACVGEKRRAACFTLQL